MDINGHCGHLNDNAQRMKWSKPILEVLGCPLWASQLSDYMYKCCSGKISFKKQAITQGKSICIAS